MIAAEAGRHFDPDVVSAFAGIDDATLSRIAAENR
jgi:response regulator RpfG family c-di-GMP phosphodiesterase